MTAYSVTGPLLTMQGFICPILGYFYIKTEHKVINLLVFTGNNITMLLGKKKFGVQVNNVSLLQLNCRFILYNLLERHKQETALY